MLKRIGTTDNIGDFITGVKEGKERASAIGSTRTTTRGPRSSKSLRRRLRGDRSQSLLKIAQELEIALEDEYFVKCVLYPNVDFYSG